MLTITPHTIGSESVMYFTFDFSSAFPEMRAPKLRVSVDVLPTVPRAVLRDMLAPQVEKMAGEVLRSRGIPASSRLALEALVRTNLMTAPWPGEAEPTLQAS